MNRNSRAKKYEVSPDNLCWQCDTADMDFEFTDELSPLQNIIGQDRALGAIKFGLDLDKPGYNIFVTGLTGTGRTSAIKAHLESMTQQRRDQGVIPSLFDWCYVNNFEEPDCPRILRLTPGAGKSLSQAMDDLLKALREELPKAFNSEEYTERRKQLEEQGRARHQQEIRELEEKAHGSSFALRITPTGANLFPISADGQPISPEQFRSLDQAVRTSIEETRVRLMQEVQDRMENIRAIDKDTQEKAAALDREVGESSLGELFRPLGGEFGGSEDVAAFLAGLKAYSLGNLRLFSEEDPADRSDASQGSLQPPNQGDPYIAFRVNVMVDNSAKDQAPIVIESNPNWVNLFGSIDRRAFMGAYFSDHTMLKPGAVHRANGGYLVLNARDLMMNPGVWEGLKRVIRNKEARLEDPAVQAGMMTPQGLRPDSIPWDGKVVVTGDETVYRTLSTYDRDDFREMFKVKAEFDSQIDLSDESVADYCSFIHSACHDEGLLHCDRTGAARIVEFGARLAADQTKLSTRFGLVKDLLIESDYWARQDGADRVSGAHVKTAIDRKMHRLNLMEERLRELISDGTIMVDLSGEVVGQVNGLAVYDLGDFSFGRPSRITARTYAGRSGVINIEREAQLSGRIHDKGVLILSGYLGSKFAQDMPLALSASLSFEQSYEGVDGDSASSTELYAILSSLADVPIAQGIAVTGSVNQRGEIQPIGGVNEKVEGFFALCRMKGLTGEQGVIVPHQNVRNLMLREDVVDSIQRGEFHIYAVKTIDEGIEALTGIEAGERIPESGYPEGTINWRVQKRLTELAGVFKSFYSGMAPDTSNE